MFSVEYAMRFANTTLLDAVDRSWEEFEKEWLRA
jgi:hypothetical protein